MEKGRSMLAGRRQLRISERLCRQRILTAFELKDTPEVTTATFRAGDLAEVDRMGLVPIMEALVPSLARLTSSGPTTCLDTLDSDIIFLEGSAENAAE
jgi:hypothetical protein